MGLINKGNVNMVITNRVLRYAFQKNGNIEEHDLGEIELPPGTIRDGVIEEEDVLRKVLTEVVKKKRWKGKKLSFCLPDDSVVIRPLQIPAPLTKEEATGYVQTQIGHSFYLPYANPAIAIEFLQVENQQRNILLYAYPQEKVEAFQRVFREVGLKPVVADLTSLSVYRYFFHHYRKTLEHEHILHIQWNWDALLLTAFHNDKAVFTRYVKTSNDGLQEEKEEFIDGLIRENMIEITRIIDFYQFSISKGQAAIDYILLAGDFPYLEKVKQALNEATSIEMNTSQESIVEQHYMDVLGLALKHAVGRGEKA